MTVSADIFADGHDVVDAALQYRRDGTADWQYEPMRLVTNDRWEAQFRAGGIGIYFYTLRGWLDRFKTWARDLGKKADAGQDLTLDLKTGAQFLAAAAERARSADLEMLNALSARLERIAGTDAAAAVAFSEDEDLIALMSHGTGSARAIRFTRKSWWCASIARGRGSARGMKCFRARAQLRPSGLECCAIALSTLNTWRIWDLTFCICRRFIRSG